MRLTRFAPLTKVPGVRLLSLQKGAGSEQLAEAAAAGWEVHDYGSRLGTSFADTAALLANLDLIVTVDTALAHLAGRWACRSGWPPGSPPTGAGCAARGHALVSDHAVVPPTFPERLGCRLREDRHGPGGAHTHVGCFRKKGGPHGLSPLPCTRGRGVGGEGVWREPRNPSPPSTGERGVKGRGTQLFPDPARRAAIRLSLLVPPRRWQRGPRCRSPPP